MEFAGYLYIESMDNFAIKLKVVNDTRPRV